MVKMMVEKYTGHCGVTGELICKNAYRYQRYQISYQIEVKLARKIYTFSALQRNIGIPVDTSNIYILHSERESYILRTTHSPLS